MGFSRILSSSKDKRQYQNSEAYQNHETRVAWRRNGKENKQEALDGTSLRKASRKIYPQSPSKRKERCGIRPGRGARSWSARKGSKTGRNRQALWRSSPQGKADFEAVQPEALVASESQKRVSEKIEFLRHEGIPERQAVGEAEGMERSGRLGRHGVYRRKKKRTHRRTQRRR